MEIQICGAGKTVTGSCYSIKVGNEHILVDCGMFQGSKSLQRRNFEPFPFDVKDIDAVLLTHAHLDHCGRLPKLGNQGFVGNIFCTEPTKELSKIVMLDSANIQEHDTENENRRRLRKGLPERKPIYLQDDVKKLFSQFKTVGYHKKVNITPNIVAVFYDAGHILGSSTIRLEVNDGGEKKSIIFSGDVGQYGTPLVCDPEGNIGADYLFTESTYGDRLHKPIEGRKQELLDALKYVETTGGKLLIPSFSIERTQELLYDMNELFEKNFVRMPVYLDSPMAIKATEVFKKFHDFFEKRVSDLINSGDNPFTFPSFAYSVSVQESIKLRYKEGPMVIIAGSGMCTAGRIKHHIKNHLWDPKSMILFVGYQSPGTLGYYIKRGAKEVRLLGTEVVVKGKVSSIDGFSGHADYKSLLTWTKHLGNINKKIFICHGDPESAISYKEKLEEEGFKEVYIPNLFETIKL